MKINSITQALQKIRHGRVNRKYKDHLFRFVFQNKKDLLDLYNAVNGTDYANPEELVITTLQDVVYLGMKNDVSFLIGNYMNLYEHQSTFCPNMPLRGLLYFAEMYRAYIEANGLNLYSTAPVTLPTPKYVIFYNGTQNEPERVELRLSDAFEEKDKEAALECKAIMLNINYGHNKALMKRCKRLEDYAYFIQAIRNYLAEGKTLERAAELAISECIEKNILADILRQNRAEVLNLLLTVYDKKLHEKTLREEGREEGIGIGQELGLRLGKQEDLLEILKEKGTVSSALQTVILSEKNLEILHGWIKLAIRVETVEEFERRMYV